MTYPESNGLGRPLAALAMLVALAAGGATLAGCQSGTAGDWHAAAAQSPSAESSPSQLASPTAAQTSRAPSGPAYTVGTNVCPKIPFSALGNWLNHRPSNNYGGARTQQGPGFHEIDCNFTGEPALGGASTDVDASFMVFDSTDNAREGFNTFDKFSDGRSTFDVTNANFDKTLSGIGEEANGYYWSAQATPDANFASSSYLVLSRKGNVVLAVHVRITDPLTKKTYSKQTMVGRVGPEAKAIAALATKA